MLTRRIIPCLDCRDGQVVKGIQFDQLRELGSPAEFAARYQQQGADEIVLLDVAATPQAREHQLESVQQVRQRLAIPLTVGGGVRRSEDVARLLASGADKVAMNTAAVTDPELIRRCADRFGVQCIVLAVDARRSNDDSWKVVVESGRRATEWSVVDWCRTAEQLGAGEVLLTSWDRDGTRSGFDLDLIHRVSSSIDIPVIASGGADSLEDFRLAVEAGADAVLAASIFHYGNHTVAEVKSYLQKNEIEVRL